MSHVLAEEASRCRWDPARRTRIAHRVVCFPAAVPLHAGAIRPAFTGRAAGSTVDSDRDQASVGSRLSRYTGYPGSGREHASAQRAWTLGHAPLARCYPLFDRPSGRTSSGRVGHRPGTDRGRRMPGFLSRSARWISPAPVWRHWRLTGRSCPAIRLGPRAGSALDLSPEGPWQPIKTSSI